MRITMKIVLSSTRFFPYRDSRAMIHERIDNRQPETDGWLINVVSGTGLYRRGDPRGLCDYGPCMMRRRHRANYAFHDSQGSDPRVATCRGKLQNKRSKLNQEINKELRLRAGAENLFK